MTCLDLNKDKKTEKVDSSVGKEPFKVVENEVIYSKYQVKKFLNKGCFGQVFHCVKQKTKEDLVVKIVRNDMSWNAKKEVAALRQLRKLDQDKNNLVKYIEDFVHKGHHCLVFEKLDMDLHSFMKKRKFEPLSFSEIRVICQQMMVALSALKSLGLVHTDIKPDNIMLVNHKEKPFKVKLIDFGLAKKVSELEQGKRMQALGYRSPEVILGLPLSEAIDMWSMGCVMAYLCLGRHLYPTKNEYEMMKIISKIQGQPKSKVLNSGLFTGRFFIKDESSHKSSWILKTSEEYNGSDKTQHKGISSTFTSLNDVVQRQPKLKDAVTKKDVRAFQSLLKKMLCVDPEKRITPCNALEHRFITKSHLDTNSNDPYVSEAHSTVQKCKMDAGVKTPPKVEKKCHKFMKACQTFFRKLISRFTFRARKAESPIPAGVK